VKAHNKQTVKYGIFPFCFLGIALASSLLILPFYWQKIGTFLIISYILCIFTVVLTKGFVQGLNISNITGYANALGLYLSLNANFFKGKSKTYILGLAVISPLFALYAILY
jgi:hypothetical protein